MRLWTVATAYGLWLFCIELVFYLVGGKDPNALQYSVLTGVVPVALQLLLLGVDPIGLAAPAKFSLVLLLVILLSYLGNTGDWTPVFYVCDTAFVLGITVLVAGSPDRRLLRSIAVIASILIGVLLIYIDLTGEYVWGRLSANGIQPNFWGTSGLAVAVGALASRWLPVGLFGVSAGLFTIYEASARGSLVGFVAAVLVLFGHAIMGLRGRRLVMALLATGAVCITIMAVPDYLIGIGDVISRDLLLLDDPNRGLGSGFTGRQDLWGDALGAWIKSPLFGVGFHQSDQVTNLLGAHNAYLATLADMGICGLVVYLWFLGWSFLAAFPIRDPQSRRFVLGIIASYSVYGLFEARAFNLGNPFSLLFLMGAFYAIVSQQRSRVSVQPAPAADETGAALLEPRPFIQPGLRRRPSAGAG